MSENSTIPLVTLAVSGLDWGGLVEHYNDLMQMERVQDKAMAQVVAHRTEAIPLVPEEARSLGFADGHVTTAEVFAEHLNACAANIAATKDRHDATANAGLALRYGVQPGSVVELAGGGLVEIRLVGLPVRGHPSTIRLIGDTVLPHHGGWLACPGTMLVELTDNDPAPRARPDIRTVHPEDHLELHPLVDDAYREWDRQRFRLMCPHGNGESEAGMIAEFFHTRTYRLLHREDAFRSGDIVAVRKEHERKQRIVVYHHLALYEGLENLGTQSHWDMSCYIPLSKKFAPYTLGHLSFKERPVVELLLRPAPGLSTGAYWMLIALALREEARLAVQPILRGRPALH